MKSLLHRYEHNSDRIFDDEVIEAGIEFAGAFLLGRDVRAISTGSDATLLRSLVSRISTLDDWDSLEPAGIDDDLHVREADRLRNLLTAFMQGFCWPEA